MMRVVVVFSTYFLGSVLGSGIIKRKFIKQPLSPPPNVPSSGIVRSKLECATICGRDLTMNTISFNKTTKYCSCSAPTQGNYLDLSVKQKMDACLSNAGYRFELRFGFCYKIEGSDLVTADDANTICKSDRGYLVRILNKDVNDFLVNLLNVPEYNTIERMFIDGSDNETEGVWKFSNGEMMTFNDWRPGDPAVNPDWNCLEFYRPADMKWVPVPCTDPSKTGGYICEIDV